MQQAHRAVQDSLGVLARPGAPYHTASSTPMHVLSSASSHSCAQVGDLQDFIKEYNLQCPMAVQRLVASGMPATVEHGKPSGASHNIARLAAETVQYFITAMDAVKMKMAAADEVRWLQAASPGIASHGCASPGSETLRWCSSTPSSMTSSSP